MVDLPPPYILLLLHLLQTLCVGRRVIAACLRKSRPYVPPICRPVAVMVHLHGVPNGCCDQGVIHHDPVCSHAEGVSE